MRLMVRVASSARSSSEADKDTELRPYAASNSSRSGHRVIVGEDKFSHLLTELASQPREHGGVEAVFR